MKHYLLTMLVLLVLALGAGIVVWYLYQDLNVTALVRSEEQKSGESLPAPQETSLGSSSSTDTTPEPINITADSLSTEQRKMLESFGYGNAEFTITERMIICAKTKVGEERLNEIINGAAPTPLESLSLLPCMKSD
jgi:hypothetical protein